MKLLLSSLLILVALPAFAQQPAPGDIDTLVADLAGDDFLKRQQAADRLYELRKASETPLRAYKTEDLGMKARVEFLLTRIDERKLLDAEMPLEKEILLNGGPARALAASPADGRIATSSPWGGVVVWNVNPLEGKRFLETGDHVATALAFDPEGKRLAVAADNVAVWNLESGEQEKVLAPAGSPVIAWSTGGEAVAFASAAGELVLADPSTGDVKSKLDLSKSDLRCVVAVPDNTFAAGCEDGTVVIVSAETGKEVSRSNAGAPVRGIAPFPDGTLALAFASGKIHWGTVDTDVPGRVRSLAIDHSGKRLIAGFDGGIRVWDSDGTRVPHVGPPRTRLESCVALIHPKMGRVVALDWNGLLVSWRAPDQPTTAGHWPRFRDLVWTRDGLHIAVWGTDLAFADVATGKTNFVRNWAPFSMVENTSGWAGPGPAQVYVSQPNVRNKIWDASTGTAVREMVEDRDAPLLNPQWTSPDHALRIDTEGMDGIWLRPVIAGGGGTGVAMSRANRFLFDASWSRDSKRVAYTVLYNGEAKIATILADSSGKRLFEQVDDGASGAVGIDPGNRWLVWSVGSDVKRLALDNLDINAAANVPVSWFQFLDDKTMLGVTEGEISLWFTPWFRVSRYFNLGPVSAWSVSPGGSHMALLSPGSLRIYRIAR